MPKQRKPEDSVRMALSATFDEMIRQRKNLNMNLIEVNIRAYIDAPDSQLGITNFYRLKKYFQDKYFPEVPYTMRPVLSDGN